MNIAYFITAKSEVSFLYDDFTLRQGLEKMRYHGYTAIPVLSRDNKYVGTVSEGDFLWYLMDETGKGQHDLDTRLIEDKRIKDILTPGKNPPVRITVSIEKLLNSALEQNFIPVIDDRDYFIGIITRKDIIRHFADSKVANQTPEHRDQV